MTLNKKVVVTLIVIAILAVGFFMVRGVSNDEVFVSKPDLKTNLTSERDDSVYQHNQIIQMLHLVNFHLDKSIDLELCYDNEGNSYYIGILDEKMDALFGELVETYNADPSTSLSIDATEVRYNLTEGITAAAFSKDQGNSFYAFLAWCGKPADLVYKETGATVNTKLVTNYIFMVDKEALNNWEYRWEYDMSH